MRIGSEVKKEEVKRKRVESEKTGKTWGGHSLHYFPEVNVVNVKGSKRLTAIKERSHVMACALVLWYAH